eukprot:PhM_4_TR16769/c0_g3_i2/m.75228
MFSVSCWPAECCTNWTLSPISTSSQCMSRCVPFSSQQKLNHCAAVLMPVHVRHHWATAIVEKASDGIRAVVYDSAPSPMTKRDITKCFRLLRIPVRLLCVVRQPRESNQCGLHVVLFGMWLRVAPATLPQHQPSSIEVVNLSTWRAKLAATSIPATELHTLFEATGDSNLTTPALKPLRDSVNARITAGAPPTLFKPRKEPLRPINPSGEVVYVEDTIPDSDFSEVPVTAEELEVKNCSSRTRSRLSHCFRKRKIELEALPTHNATIPVAIVFRRLPKSLQRLGAVQRAFRCAARRILSEASHTKSEENQMFLAQPAGPISSGAVDFIAQQLQPQHSSTTIIKTSSFTTYAHVGRDTDIPKSFADRVAVVIHYSMGSDGHFILATYDGSEVRVQDSLCPSSLHPQLVPYIERFLELLRVHGKSIPETVTLKPCALQATNDCAIESINNLVYFIAGKKGSLTRAHLAAAHKHYNAHAHPGDFVFNIIPGIVKLPASHKGPQQPQQAVLSHNDPVAAHLVSCCNRQHFADGYCAWHHPAVIALPNRKQCTSRTRAGKGPQCQESALSFLQNDTCFYHASLDTRQRLAQAASSATHKRTEVIATRQNDPYSFQVLVQQPEATMRVANSSGPLAHQHVSSLMRGFQVGQQLVITYKVSTNTRRQCRTSAAKVAQRHGDTSMVYLTHERCTRCENWHCVPTSDPTAIPSKGMDYFMIELLNTPINDADVTDMCYSGDDDDELGSDVDDDDIDTTRGVHHHPFADERQTIGASSVSPTQPTPNDLRYLRITNPGERPFDVHKTVWNSRSSETRRKHAVWLVRLKSLPYNMMSWPLAKAVVELILMHAQSKHWAWSTIASNMSMAASALESLSLYANTTATYNIRDDPYFRAANEKAQKNARISAVRPFKAEALAVENVERISMALRANPSAWSLFHLCWNFAARLGDMRRVNPREIVIDFDNKDDPHTVPVFATFTEGKGAHFWGPYTVHTRVPTDVAKTVQEHIRHRVLQRYLFTTQDQEIVAKEVRKFPDHKSEDTLKRYLQWGKNDADARQAAL